MGRWVSRVSGNRLSNPMAPMILEDELVLLLAFSVVVALQKTISVHLYTFLMITAAVMFTSC